MRRWLTLGMVFAGMTTLALRYLAGTAWTASLARDTVCAVLSPDPLSATLRGLDPDFDLADRTGKHWSLGKLRGQPVLVSFWATWCPPCVEEMPSLEALARRLEGKATVLAISVDEDWATVDKFFPKGTALTVLLDPSREIPARYGTSKFPETFLVDREGRVRHAFINKRDWSPEEAVACITGQ
jgi:cytochrome c biogenesis protein CcmG, thiol:disulfide interchange protein DsbE